MKAQTLKEYIEEHYDGNQAKFARSISTKNRTIARQQVGVWIKDDYIVVIYEHRAKLYSARRDL